jgi:hypothetical protein
VRVGGGGVASLARAPRDPESGIWIGAKRVSNLQARRTIFPFWARPVFGCFDPMYVCCSWSCVSQPTLSM